LFIGTDSVEGVFVCLQVEGIDQLSDFIEDLVGGLIDQDFLADLFSQGLFDWADGCGEQGYLLKLGVA
jgi:hypothetical protein